MLDVVSRLARPVARPGRAAPRRALAIALALAAGWAVGCSNSVKPPSHEDVDPETQLTYAPVQNDSTYFRVHLYWSGTDADGEVTGFRFATDADTTLPVGQWRLTTAHDTTLAFGVDPVAASASHAFMISAVDNAGRTDKTPAKRVFATRTVPPVSRIDRGPAAFNPTVGPTFTFAWSGTDPDGIEIGHATPVDSFEYLLLEPGASRASGHPPLPPFDQALYVALINQSTGGTLPPPYDDWAWTGLRAPTRRFTGVPTGEYVFAERAVDVAGAAERSLEFVRNIRHFTVINATPPRASAPVLTVTADVLFAPLASSTGPVDGARQALELMEGETVSFSWFADASSYGGVVSGYTYALDDTSALPPLALGVTAATLSPARLTPGPHALYVRAIDDEGVVTNAVIPLFIVHAAFKDPGAPREILYVDDSQSPGAVPQRIGNFPSDGEEDDYWTLVILPRLGVPYSQWDTYLAGLGDVGGRKQPGLRDLARYSTVIWNVDFNNSVSSPTALYKTLVGGRYPELANYLRAGGTLILSGMSIGSNICEPRSTLYSNASQGICSGLEAGSNAYKLSYFPRTFAGLDGAKPSDQGLRTLGARDFIAAYPTTAGMAAGLDTLFVDRGDVGSGAKWITNQTLSPGTDPNSNRTPGLPAVDGWNLAASFGCELDPTYSFTPENPARPIAEALFTYHGVNVGVNEEGGPSPREGMVAGIRVQAHRPVPATPPDDYGTPPPAFDPHNSVGRMVVLSFPLYFLKDEGAIRTLMAAYAYVSGSPTLP